MTEEPPVAVKDEVTVMVIPVVKVENGMELLLVAPIGEPSVDDDGEVTELL